MIGWELGAALKRLTAGIAALVNASLRRMSGKADALSAANISMSSTDILRIPQ